jgi:hypothetical protein
MLHRIRLAMQDDMSGGTLNGQIEIDETFVGGKARNMHKDRKIKAMGAYRGGTEGGNKTIVLGMLERKGRVRTAVIGDRKKKTIEPHVVENIANGATINTDEFSKGWYESERPDAL